MACQEVGRLAVVDGAVDGLFAFGLEVDRVGDSYCEESCNEDRGDCGQPDLHLLCHPLTVALSEGG